MILLSLSTTDKIFFALSIIIVLFIFIYVARDYSKSKKKKLKGNMKDCSQEIEGENAKENMILEMPEEETSEISINFEETDNIEKEEVVVQGNLNEAHEFKDETILSEVILTNNDEASDGEDEEIIIEEEAEVMLEEIENEEEADAPVLLLEYSDETEENDLNINEENSKRAFNVKLAYDEIKNYIKCYGFSSKLFKGKEVFRKLSVTHFKIEPVGYKLYFYINIINNFSKRYHTKSVILNNQHFETPTLLEVQSNRSIKYAKELIDMIAVKQGLTKKPNYVRQDFVEKYPFDTK